LTNLGIVYLIGAGPGDPGLITVRGRQRLAEADVVLYDRLIGDELLDAAHPDAELIYVGKSAQGHRLSQDEINALLVEKARAGLKVARLKGGDPFVFGRGGEEGEVLVEAGVPFEVVPGITSPIAVPAYAGIPVTHRDIASNFAVVTGHRRKGGEGAEEGLGLDWDALARIDTLVVLMGVGNLPVIVRELLGAGRGPDTPAALIRWGTTPRQETVAGTLGTIVERVRKAGLRPPAVLVVGDVVALRDHLRWFDRGPLFGLRVLVSRPRDKAGQMAACLRDLGADPVIFPTIAIRPPDSWEPLDAAVEQLSTYDWVIFTSTNGVRFFWDRLEQTGRDARAFAGAHLAAIGPITAQELTARGLRPDLVPDQYVAEAILEEIGEVRGKRILLPRADIARPALADGLLAAGAEVDEVAAYRTVPTSATDAQKIREMLAAGEIDVLTFTSSSTVRNFVAAIEPLPDLPHDTVVACIGPITAQTAEELGLPVHVSADEHTIDGLLNALIGHSSTQRRGAEKSDEPLCDSTSTCL
jgi:uroporphyrinogen III methyltransferase/synthase